MEMEAGEMESVPVVFLSKSQVTAASEWNL